MNLKNKFALLIILGIILGLSACSNDKEEEEEVLSYATLNDVSLKQTINEKDAFELTDLNEELFFSSGVSFNEKTINWSKPTLEQSFSNLFDISKNNVSVTDSKGNILTSTDITLNNNKITVSFHKVNNSFKHLNSSTFYLHVKTKIKEAVSEEALADFNDYGYKSYSTFYGEVASQNIKSNTIVITSKLDLDAEYNITGDPKNDNYPYKLNVVYFIPSDIQENAGYKRRISTILLKHQLFVCKWMKHWGYEEKSFGLPLDHKGMVEIITVKGKEPKSGYPYSGGANKMADEIKQHYTNAGLKSYSEHTLVISAINADTDETPFYGLGKWCYALDYPGMAYETMAIDPTTGQALAGNTSDSHKATVWIGGMLHELGHGLNQPHVGPAYSQKNNTNFGITLMGSGNRTYGESPTFMHQASAATLNNCQISSFTQKTFYNETSASVKITDIQINGNQFTLKGNFTTSSKATDVIVRFYKATETFLGGSHGYSSVAFVTKPQGNNFELTVPIEEMRVNEFDYRVGVSVLMENGTAKHASKSHIYKLEKQGSSYTFTNENIINPGDWEVKTSHNLPVDEPISNAPESLVDGDLTTCLSMVKPGKSYGGISVPSSDIVYAIINFKKPLDFNMITLTNRNLQKYLNTQTVSFYGSNDGVNFTHIITADLPEDKVNNVSLGLSVNYQYLKMTFDKWDKTSGSTMQFAELELKNEK